MRDPFERSGYQETWRYSQSQAGASWLKRMEVESEMMLADIEKLMYEQPLAFAASNIGQTVYPFFAYLLGIAERKEVAELRLRAMRDPRCRDKFSDSDRQFQKDTLDALTERPPETFPLMFSVEDAMIHGDCITAQLLAHEYLCDPEDADAPEDIGQDLSPYTLGAFWRMRFDAPSDKFYDPFTTDKRPPVLVEKCEDGKVVESAWQDGREVAA